MFKTPTLKSISALSVFALSVTLGAQAYAHPDDDDKKDHIVQTFDFKGFDGIEVVGVYNMDVKVGKDFSIEASGRAKEMNRLSVEVKNGALVLSTDEKKKRSWRGKNNNRGIDITITLPALNSLEITGIGNGEITGIDSERFDLDVSGIGAVELDGKCGTLDADFSGMGDLDAENLKCKEVKVDVSGMGSASVYASEKVDADMSGMGSIDVYGKPKTVKKDKTFMSSVDIH